MSDNQGQPRPTPPRRRNGRHHGKSSAQKMYASENDVSGASAPAPPRTAAQPFTPQKSASASPEPSSLQGQGQVASAKGNRHRHPHGNDVSGNHSAGGNKSRAKHVAQSPSASRTPRQATPNGAPAVKTVSASATAFAGSTFQHSPAPSELPIPSWMAKSAVATASRPQAQQLQQQPSPPASDPEAPTPHRPLDAAIQESPLEAMFRADRAEKASGRSSSFAGAAIPRPGLHSPAQNRYSPAEPQTMPQQYNGYMRERPYFQRSNSGIPLSELDGSPGEPLGPAFSTPYHERIRAARASPQTAANKEAQPPAEDPSEALKKVLFGPKKAKVDAPAPPPAATHSMNTTMTPGNAPPMGAPVGGPRTASAPAPHAPQANDRSKELAIEGALWDILKIK